jgi:hypothetical protein
VSYATLANFKEYVDDPKVATGVTYDGVIQNILDRCDEFIDLRTERSFRSTNLVRTYDGDWKPRLFLRADFIAITQVRVRMNNQEAWRIVPLTDIVMQPVTRRTGRPIRWIELVDFPSGPDFVFPRGLQTVEVTGAEGYAAVAPKILVEFELEMAVRVWRARGVGFSDVVGLSTDQIDNLIVTKAIPALGYDIIKRLAAPAVFA